jgi:protein MAK16
MHNDETIWHCINQDFCSFKVKLVAPKQNFCRNEYNVTGLCNRVSCPLANSQYATVIEEEGICYLYMKTVERAHSPKNMWEKIKLSRNYLQALEQISKNMEYWPEHQINRCKQRLTKMRQMLIRMRKLSMKEGVRLVPIKKKTERRERTRELKAEVAAKVDLAIEKELLERLKQGTYGDIYNFPKKQFNSVMDKNKEEEEEDELEEDDDDEEFVEDLGDDEEELDGEFEDEIEPMVERLELEELGGKIRDLEDMVSLGAIKKRRRDVPRVELEYEQEMQ